MAAACILRVPVSYNVKNVKVLHFQINPFISRTVGNATVHKSFLSTDISDTNSSRTPDLKRIQRNQISRNVTTEANPAAFALQSDSEVPETVSLKHLDTTFTNSEEAYRSKKASELLRALFVFRVTSFESLVTHNAQVCVCVMRLFSKAANSQDFLNVADFILFYNY